VRYCNDINGYVHEDDVIFIEDLDVYWTAVNDDAYEHSDYCWYSYEEKEKGEKENDENE
jgi:hypothetical protein